MKIFVKDCYYAKKKISPYQLRGDSLLSTGVPFPNRLYTLLLEQRSKPCITTSMGFGVSSYLLWMAVSKPTT